MIYLVLLCCLFFSAFFSGLETGLLAADQMAIYIKRESGLYSARAAAFLLLKPERLLGTTLVGTNFAVVTAAVLFSSHLRSRGLAWGPVIGSLALSLVLLFFAEIMPKSFFRRHADTVSVRLAPVLVIFYFLFLPLSLVLNGFVKVVLFSFGKKEQSSKLPRSRRDLRLLVRLGARESGMTEKRMFEDIFDFRDTLAREVMIKVHTHPVCSIEASLGEAVRIASTEEIRFVPVFRERADNIVGYIDIENLLENKAESVAEALQQVCFFPDTKKIPELLMDMNRKKLEVVFLSDEYGAVSGLITPAVIAAEIIGFIPGEQTQEPSAIKVIDPAHFLVKGITDIEDLYHETGIDLPKGNYDTVGGYLCQRLGEIPVEGQVFEENGIRYRIVDRDERHIREIEINKES